MVPGLPHWYSGGMFIIKSILTVFEGYNGSYIPPRHVPKNQVDQNSLEHDTSKLFPMLARSTTRYIPRERALSRKALKAPRASPSALPRLYLSEPFPVGYNGSYFPLTRDITYTYCTPGRCIAQIV